LEVLDCFPVDHNFAISGLYTSVPVSVVANSPKPGAEGELDLFLSKMIKK